MTNKSSPKISIITPSYNSEKYIQEAIESVLKQDYPNFEHIVVDGESTDETVEILNQYPHLNVIREPDDGIYDAMNKGLREATGELIGWMNSDDRYVNNAFLTVVEKYNEQPDSDMIAGGCEVFKQRNGEREIINQLDFTRPSSFKDYDDEYEEVRLSGINGCFFTKTLVNSVGQYDSSVRIAGDLDYMVRIMAIQPIISEVEEVIYQYRSHEGSITFNETNGFDCATEIRLNESMKFMVEHANNPQMPSPLQSYCLSSFRVRSGTLFKNYMINCQIISALQLAAYCFRQDKMWPTLILREFLYRYVLPRKLSTKFVV